ncbi:hypothetical protein MXE91_11870 [Mammaliicoccus sciuri]|uniref:hypothetical protein n=1 Tax=Mammaliicoccus sciuri TaxID=1296 RepID=UPI001E2BF466|nr:hypothetical protein [Mammaliicoccus sciuri]MCD8882642.1 hypothetical protein [Mammaliicoccus sciuri]MEB5791487.1 hypothetical protein [Mammaliicoccus sciuri]
MEMTITQYFLVERDETGKETCLVKNYGSGFNRGATPQSAHKFKTEEEAKTACKAQNMLAELFGTNFKTYYVAEQIERSKHNPDGTDYIEPSTSTEEDFQERNSELSAQNQGID